MSECIFVKKCTKCAAEKTILDFSKNKNTKDGLQHECKSCSKERRELILSKNPDYYNNASKAYIKRNPKPKSVNSRHIPYEKGTAEYNEERRRRRNEYCKKYISTEKGIIVKKLAAKRSGEKRKASRIHLRENNPELYDLLLEKGREKNKLNYANNKEAYSAAWHRRRARIIGNGGIHTKEDISNLLLSQKYKCAVCLASIKVKKHIDHIIPLSNGGTNDKSNIQLLCPPCNIRKKDKDPIEFMQSQGFLL